MADETRNDRRGAERIPVNNELSSAGSTWVSDLSRGGVFVHSEELLPVGSTIELRFSILLDDPVVLEAVGKVVRHSHRPQGMGVQFISVDPEVSARIEEVIERQAPVDSGAPLSLPEPHRHPQDETTKRTVLARPAPVDGLSLSTLSGAPSPIEDMPTAVFPSLARPAAEDSSTTLFRPPPLPGAGPGKGPGAQVDEDERTTRFPRIEK